MSWSYCTNIAAYLLHVFWYTSGLSSSRIILHGPATLRVTVELVSFAMLVRVDRAVSSIPKMWLAAEVVSQLLCHSIALL